jgi:hypothetical protein
LNKLDGHIQVGSDPRYMNAGKMVYISITNLIKLVEVLSLMFQESICSRKNSATFLLPHIKFIKEGWIKYMHLVVNRNEYTLMGSVHSFYYWVSIQLSYDGTYYQWRFIPKIESVVYSHRKKWRTIQLYVIKFVSDLRQAGFFWLLQFPPPIKLTATI